VQTWVIDPRSPWQKGTVAASCRAGGPPTLTGQRSRALSRKRYAIVSTPRLSSAWAGDAGRGVPREGLGAAHL